MSGARTASRSSATAPTATCHTSGCGEPLFGRTAYCPYCGEERRDVVDAEVADLTAPPIPLPPAAPENKAAETALPPTPVAAASTAAVAAPPLPIDLPKPRLTAPEAKVVAPPATPAGDRQEPSGKRPTDGRLAGPVPIAGLQVAKPKQAPPRSPWSWLIGLAVVAVLVIVVATSTTGSRPSGDEMFVSRTVSVRAAPTASGNTPVAQLERGAQVVGRWTDETPDGERWLRITDGPYKDHYVWAGGISDRAPPPLAMEVKARRRVLQAGPVYAQPWPDSPVMRQARTGERIYVVGQTRSTWFEVTVPGGGVGYVPSQTFAAPQSAAPPSDAAAQASAPPPIATNQAVASGLRPTRPPPPRTYRASFNCAAARNRAETLICTDPQLAATDRQMARLFNQVTSRSPGAARVRAEQRDWLRTRNAATSRGQLAQAYATRVDRLNRELADLMVPPPRVIASAPPPPSVSNVVTNPDWLRRPSGEDMGRYYPARAVQRSLQGQATIACTVNARGSLRDCQVVSEDPAGEGFGAAALRMTHLFRMRPMTHDGMPVDGGRVRIPIRFRL